MKKVIKPSKQPTKKQSQRRQRNTNTAKLKKAIGKIAAQLVKNHPKLVKGGGSSGITDLIFSKNLMKGGEINDTLRGDIVNFLKDSAPKVNKLKKDLLMKLIEYFINNEKAVTDDSVSIVNINKDFDKGVYKYKDNYIEPFKEPLEDKQDIYDDFIILGIVKKFYILSRIKDDIPKEISDDKFEKLPDEFITELEKYKHDGTDEVKKRVKTEIKDLLDKYKSDKEVDVKEVGVEGNTPPKKDNDETTLAPYTATEMFSDIKETELLQDEKGLPRAEPKVSTDRTPGNDATLLRTKLTESSAVSEAVPDDEARRYEDTSGQSELPREGAIKRGGGGGLPPKYKSTGQVVNIMYKKRKYKRTIFVKEKRKTKYCKINNEYILLSKLNVL